MISFLKFNYIQLFQELGDAITEIRRKLDAESQARSRAEEQLKAEAATRIFSFSKKLPNDIKG